MAEPLKNFFDHAIVRSIGKDVRSAYAAFDEDTFFTDGVAGLEDLSLSGRASHVAECLRRHLPADFEQAAALLTASLGLELESSETFGLAPLRYWPQVIFVARFGLEHFETSMSLQYELTKRFSAEGSIRAFLERHPERTLERLRLWACDPNVHVRRLVSEGTRPRLPWAKPLHAFQKDPRPVLALLEMLKDDPERYVQRSVANNLNDIGKDHPAIVTEVCRLWAEEASAGRRWIVNHALRSLVKKGDPSALGILGAGQKPAVAVQNVLVSPSQVRIGDRISVAFELSNVDGQAQDLLIDYVVHFVKANGQSRPKVFKLRRVQLAATESARLEARVSFAKMTTRTHYPGAHHVELLVNGVRFPLCTFEVTA